MDPDPVISNPHLYAVLFENERVRVLEYRDQPGEKSTPHRHPDSVMVTLSGFDRRPSSGDRQVDLSLPSGAARWLAAQTHTGENIGTTETHAIFVELREQRAGIDEEAPRGPAPLGPV